MTVDPEALPLFVPSFLIQPLVENAFRHGIARKPGHATLDVTAAIVNGLLRIDVQDDGAGLMPGFSLDRDAGTGLRNIRTRLQQLYGSSASFSIESRSEGGTRVSVVLPVEYEATRAKASA